MANWNEQLDTIEKLRQQRIAADAFLYSTGISLLNAKRDFRKDPSAEAARKIKALEVQKVRAKTDSDQAVTNLQEAIHGIYVDPHPKNVVSNLDDSIPFLLLPVRIETRFITGAAPELWLRVYPDDMSIHAHEKLLKENEVIAGEQYWKALFDAEKNGGDEKEDQKKNAWNNIASVFSGRRAAWIMRQTKPANWSTDLSGIETADQLTFPPQALTTTDTWTLAPRTNVLPDKFVVMCYEGENITKEVVGPLIPDQLYMGPDPLDAETAFIRAEDETLTFGASFDWTADFDKAIAVGMGFRIALTTHQAQTGFDRILVMGVYLSAAKDEGQKAIETLIDNHHYSSKGFGIAIQGTPTNNTEQDAAGFSENDPFNNTSYKVEAGAPLFGDNSACDGRNLADALGIEYAPLQFILNSDAGDHREAVAMNKALYPSTLGYYFDTMLKPVLDETDQSKLRDFFTRHVSGRGPLPAIRVGNQPYGLLLTSDFSKWKATDNDTVFGKEFLDTCYDVVNHYHGIWKSLAGQLAYTGKPGSDPDESLMNILGLQSGSVSFAQRVGFARETLLNNAAFMQEEENVKAILDNFFTKNDLLNFLSNFGYDRTGDDGSYNVPLQLLLIFQHYHTGLPASNVIEKAPLSESDGLHYYDEELKKNYIHWLLENTSLVSLEKQDFPEGKLPSALLYLQLRRAMLLELAKASVEWVKRGNLDLSMVMQPEHFYNIRPVQGLTKWEVMKAKVGQVLTQDAQQDKTVADHLLTTGKNEKEAAFLKSMKESLVVLANLPTARLERCFTEHIDTCTYRLDAWQTALFDQRLQKQRNPDPQNGGQRKKGIFLGSYGWVENVRPSSRKHVMQEPVHEKLKPLGGKPLYEYVDNGGFVHAPSINHAVAAAVLRSGYLSHASVEQPDLMAVNLSSERIRRAQFILQGITNGQTLEALLGYQFERGLHDRASVNDDLKRLNEYIYNFRDKYLIEQHLVQQQGVDPAETIPANNLVNGVKLAESRLSYPYGTDIDLSGLSAEQQESIKVAITSEKDRLEDSLDAVKDLLLSESVYQLVQGNFDRAAAVTNALKDAHVPPEIEVIHTPKSSNLGFTNRVTIQFDQIHADDPGANPWPAIPMGPRASIEPGMNKWLGKILGEPAQLVCLISHIDGEGVEALEEISIDRLQLQPIDLVYIAGNELNTGEGDSSAASELESRLAAIYRGDKSLGDETLVSIKFMEPQNAPGKRTLGNVFPLISLLKSVITDSRPLHAQEFDPSSRIAATNPANPKGYVVQDLKDRIGTALTTLTSLSEALTGLSIIKTEGGLTMTLGDLFAELDEGNKHFSEIKFVFGSGTELKNILTQICGFGLSDCFPLISDVSPAGAIELLLEQARSISRIVQAMIRRTNDLLTEIASFADTEKEKQVTKFIEAGKILFGEVFNILPQFRYGNPEDVQRSNESRDTLLQYAEEQLQMNFVAEEWLQGLSYVRPRVRRWDLIRTLYELTNNESLELLPIQLPYRENDSWLSVGLPTTNTDGSPFTITDDTLSITIHGAAAFHTGEPQSGLLIDDWTEVIPNSEEITGVSFHFNQPNAMAPQALLLAVTPEVNGSWSWDDLVGILNDTILRAKLRAVEPRLPDGLDKPEAGVLLPALMAGFSSRDLDISLDYRRNDDFFDQNLANTAVSIP